MRRSSGTNAAWLLLLAGTTAYIVLTGRWAVRNHDGVGTLGYDFGIFDQGLPESPGGEFGRECGSHRRAAAGRSQSEVGRMLTDDQRDMLEAGTQLFGDIAAALCVGALRPARR